MPIADFEIAVPATMHAAVYKGDSVVAVEQVPTPEIGAGELLVRYRIRWRRPSRAAAKPAELALAGKA